MQAPFNNLHCRDASLAPIQTKSGAKKSRNKSLSFLYFSKAIVFGLLMLSQCTHGQDKDTNKDKNKITMPDDPRDMRPRFRTADTTSSTEDNTYGKGGKMQVILIKTSDSVNHEADTEEHDTIFRDAKGKIREERSTTTYKDAGKKSLESVTIWGKTGVVIYTRFIAIDEIGNRKTFMETRYKDQLKDSTSGLGPMTYGYMETNDERGKKVLIYNSKTNKYENPGNNAMPDPNSTNINHTESFSQNLVFIGPALMHEDYTNKAFNSWGVDGSYTRVFSPHFGATVDAGLYWHTEKEDQYYSYSYNQFNITGGVTYFITPLNTANKLDFSVHLLGGLAALKETSKSSDSSYTYSDSYTYKSFTLAAGAAVDLNLSQHFAIRLQPDYTPTFFKQSSYQSKTQNNFRVSLEAGIKF